MLIYLSLPSHISSFGSTKDPIHILIEHLNKDIKFASVTLKKP